MLTAVFVLVCIYSLLPDIAFISLGNLSTIFYSCFIIAICLCHYQNINLKFYVHQDIHSIGLGT